MAKRMQEHEDDENEYLGSKNVAPALARYALEHEHHDEVGGKDCEAWTNEWWTWILSLEETKNPFTTVGELNMERYRGGQPLEVQKKLNDDKKESVWFLAASPYGSGTVRIHIPPGKWSILATPYVACASPQLYPSLKTLEALNNLVENDVRRVKELWVDLDGISLAGCISRTEKPFPIHQVPKKNIFGIEGTKEQMNKRGIANIQDGKFSIDLVHYGRWFWLKPLSTGDHLLHLHGYSEIYELDVKYQLTVAGPEE